MIKLSASVCIDTPAAIVWYRLARLEDIELWSESVLRARCDGDRTRGVGAERTCELRGNLVIHERWIAWEEGRSFTYEGSGLPLVRRAVNTWSVHPKGERQSLLTTEAQIELKGGILGWLVEPIMPLVFDRMGSNSLAAFKYLVESGHPYQGRHSELPRAPAVC